MKIPFVVRTAITSPRKLKQVWLELGEEGWKWLRNEVLQGQVTSGLEGNVEVCILF